MSSYRLARRAERDLIDIYHDTLRTFGLAQAERYTEEMRSCMEMLADHPQVGRKADRIGLGLRRHEHGGHVIFYREGAGTDGPLILTVIIARMQPNLAGADLS